MPTLQKHRISLILSMLLLFALPTQATDSTGLLGVYFDDAATLRCSDVPAYQPLTAYLIATNLELANVAGFQATLSWDGNCYITNFDTRGALNLTQAPVFDCAWSSAIPVSAKQAILCSFSVMPLDTSPIRFFLEPLANSSIPGSLCLADTSLALWACDPATVTRTFDLPAAYINATDWPCAAPSRPITCWATIKTKPGTFLISNQSGGDFAGNVAVSSTRISSILAQFSVDQIVKASGALADTFDYYDPAAQVMRTYTGMRDLFHVSIADSTLMPAFMDSISRPGEIVYASARTRGEYSSTGNLLPNDPYIGNYIRNRNNQPLTIDVTRAWQRMNNVITYPVVVGVLDNGVDFLHQELAGQYAGGSLTYGAAHGTEVAGIIAAIKSNEYGVAGIAPCNIYSYEAPNDITDADISNGLREMMASGVRLVNVSAGAQNTMDLKTTCAEFYNGNGLLVASSGNSNTSIPKPPAAYMGAMGVGSVTSIDGTKHPISNWGINTDVVVVADTVYTTVPATVVSNLEDGCRMITTGETSYAAPMVTGVAALLLKVNPWLYNDDIKALIALSANRNVLLNYDIWPLKYGVGLVQAEAAVESLLSNRLMGYFYQGCDTLTLVDTYEDADPTGVPGLGGGLYDVRQYRCRKVVYHESRGWVGMPHVWGRGVETTGVLPVGMNMQALEAFDISRYCTVVEGSETPERAVLETFLYRFQGVAPNDTLWYPSTPVAMHWACGVLGRDGATDVPPGRELETRVAQAWPNPFNAGLRIEVQGVKSIGNRVIVYDLRGRVVRRMELSRESTAIGRVDWDGKSDRGMVCPSGRYFIRLQVDDRPVVVGATMVK